MKYQLDEASIVELIEDHFRRVLKKAPEEVNITVWFDRETNQMTASVTLTPDVEWNK